MTQDEIRKLLTAEFDKGPLACDATHTMFWNVLTVNEKDALVNFIYKLLPKLTREQVHLAFIRQGYTLRS